MQEFRQMYTFFIEGSSSSRFFSEFYFDFSSGIDRMKNKDIAEFFHKMSCIKVVVTSNWTFCIVWKQWFSFFYQNRNKLSKDCFRHVTLFCFVRFIFFSINVLVILTRSKVQFQFSSVDIDFTYITRICSFHLN